MKRATILVVVFLVAATAWTQTTIGDYEEGFQSFVDEFARSLPMNSTVGLNWSDAYIGQLVSVPPSFGVGVTTGVTTIPYAAFDGLFDDLGLDIPTEISEFSAVGVPFPAYTVDARVGGFLLPFDVGLKFGALPGGVDFGDVSLEYTLFGADVRYAVIEQGMGVLPDLSIGVGYNRLNGAVSLPSGIGQIEVSEVPDDPNDPESTVTLALDEPQLDFDWGANVFDFRAQASKKILFLEPHFGIGAALGIADANAGLTTEVYTDDNGNGSLDTGEALTDAEIEQIKNAAAEAGVSLPSDFDQTGLGVESNVNSFAFRIFGGTSFNILILRLDLGLMYNITSGSVGGTLGARVQL
ncbi:MAG: hypothetical protein ACOC45_04245 [Alkalispirochaetaceae bacterium]